MGRKCFPGNTSRCSQSVSCTIDQPGSSRWQACVIQRSALSCSPCALEVQPLRSRAGAQVRSLRPAPHQAPHQAPHPTRRRNWRVSIARTGLRARSLALPCPMFRSRQSSLRRRGPDLQHVRLRTPSRRAAHRGRARESRETRSPGSRDILRPYCGRPLDVWLPCSPHFGNASRGRDSRRHWPSTGGSCA